MTDSNSVNECPRCYEFYPSHWKEPGSRLCPDCRDQIKEQPEIALTLPFVADPYLDAWAAKANARERRSS